MRSNQSHFFVSIVLIILRPLSIFHWVHAYPSDLLEIDPETDSNYIVPWNIRDALDQQAENEVVRFEEGLEDLQKIFGIRGQTDKRSMDREKIAPQFMMELYNTIADSSGVTHGKNPYNAKVVRSYIEKETPYTHVYLFNVSGLEVNESVLEAELHLYRKRIPLWQIGAAILSKAGYLMKVYQIVEGKSLAEPHSHKLLNVHYVRTRASGWQVFNVKQAVLAWVSGSPNLGLLVTASNRLREKVTVKFSRRSEYGGSKQPILVLFNDDGKGRSPKSENAQYYTYDNDSEEMEAAIDEQSGDADKVPGRRRDRDSVATWSNSENLTNLHKERSYGTQLGREKLEIGEPDYFRRQKKIGEAEEDEESGENKISRQADEEKTFDSRDGNARREENSRDSMRQRRGAFKGNRGEKERRRSEKFVSEQSRKRTAQMLSSMDIYERAMLREQLMERNVEKYERREEKDNPSGREKRSSRPVTENVNEEKSKSYSSTKRNTTECARHELYVDFKEIGLSSSIIAPKGYSAYHCRGMCNSPLSQDQQPTNHATVQGLVHKMGILADVHMPCCVPTKLLRTSILFFDDNENVVLKVYEDMVADRCGCR